MNNEVKKELGGGKTPFEVYFGRQSNEVVKPNSLSDDDSEGEVAVTREKMWPTVTDAEVQEIEDLRRQMERHIGNANARSARQMINRRLRQNPIPVYELKEKVVVRLPAEHKRKAPRKRLRCPWND